MNIIPAPAIHLETATRAYDIGGAPFLALDRIDLSIRHGQFVAIEGKSGSGKSTLLNLIAGIDRPTAGAVTVAGALLGDLTEDQLAAWRGRSVGVVFQFHQLMPALTVAENVMLPMDFCGMHHPRDRRRVATDLLALVEIKDQANKLPAALSGGQRQRAAIARALANDPPVLVADEPTGSLDSRTAEAVIDLLRAQVTKGKTVVMVTHDPELAAVADRIVTIADGRIVEDTAPAVRPPMVAFGA